MAIGDINVWEGVQVLAETARGAAVAISSISSATQPLVTTSAPHGLADNDRVLLTVSGIQSLDQRVVIADVQSSTTFLLIGDDLSTVGAGSFFAGTVQKLTINASATTFQDVNVSGGDAATIDISTIHDIVARELPGRISATSYSFGSLWNIADPVLKLFKQATVKKGALGVELVFATGDRGLFVAYPTASLLPTGTAGNAVQTPVSLKLRGPATFVLGS